MIKHKILFLTHHVDDKIDVIKQGVNDTIKSFKTASNQEIDVEANYYDISGYPLLGESITMITGSDNQSYNVIAVTRAQLSGLGRIVESELGKNFDLIVLLFKPDNVNPKSGAALHNAQYIDGFTTIQIPIFPQHERYAMWVTLAHEVLHGWYHLINERGGLKLTDDVHQHTTFDDPRYLANYQHIMDNLKPYYYLLEEPMSTQPNTDLNKLNPAFRPLAEELIRRGKIGSWKAFITEGWRSNERQNYLYAQGRYAPYNKMPIVTNAKAGQSDHNFGLAVDVAFKNSFGRVSYDPNLFLQLAPIAKEIGLSWGGDWKDFIDMPHFFITAKQAQELTGQNVKLVPYEGKYLLVTDDLGKVYKIEKNQPVFKDSNKQPNKHIPLVDAMIDELKKLDLVIGVDEKNFEILDGPRLEPYEGKYLMRVKNKGEFYKVSKNKKIFLDSEKQPDRHIPLVDEAINVLKNLGLLVGTTKNKFNELTNK